MVRIATKKDIQSILELYKEQFHFMSEKQPFFSCDGEQDRRFVKSIIAEKDSDILLCEEDGDIIGFVLLQEKQTPNFSFFVKHKYAYLMDIIVTGNKRRNGTGTLLLNEAKQWAKERNLEYIELDVLSNNKNAISFYKKHGFLDLREKMYCKL